MRAVIQRVSSASVTIDREVTCKIGAGLLVLLGIEDRDGSQDIDWLTAKLVNMRIFSDAAGIMNWSVKDTGGDILVACGHKKREPPIPYPGSQARNRYPVVQPVHLPHGTIACEKN